MSEDSTELNTSVDLDHLDERFVDVVGELDEASGTFSQFLEEREDVVDGFNGRVKLVFNDIDETSVFSFSLDSKVVEDFVNIANVLFSLSLVEQRGRESTF